MIYNLVLSEHEVNLLLDFIQRNDDCDNPELIEVIRERIESTLDTLSEDEYMQRYVLPGDKKWQSAG